MKYALPFDAPQRAVVPLRALAHLLEPSQYHSGRNLQELAERIGEEEITLAASNRTRAVLVVADDVVVFAAGPDGRLRKFVPGRWTEALEELYNAAIEGGYLLHLEPEAGDDAFAGDVDPSRNVPCPWMDRIEATRDLWDAFDC
jgi:hypothetical protein